MVTEPCVNVSFESPSAVLLTSEVLEDDDEDDDDDESSGAGSSDLALFNGG